jgi:hypothetical protein
MNRNSYPSGPAIYQGSTKDALQFKLSDQAHVGKELVKLESEWLEKQAELEQAEK